MVLMGLMPLGNLQVGILSEHFGTAVAIRAGVVVTIVATLFLINSRKQIGAAWEEYQASSGT
jgi:hypothetical protein